MLIARVLNTLILYSICKTFHTCRCHDTYDMYINNTNILTQELNKLRVNLEHKEEHLADTRKHLELANKERLSQAQQLGELQSVLTTCKRQIGLAHAAVTAESASTED